MPFGKAIFLIGMLIAVLGLVVWAGGSIPMLNRLGRLPGDIYIRRDNFSFYFPITTAIVISVVLSILLALLRR
jgi:formate hydrogenlyase subunit 3/multisubunit Na+/H+ antiporter MnhD subunit